MEFFYDFRAYRDQQYQFIPIQSLFSTMKMNFLIPVAAAVLLLSSCASSGEKDQVKPRIIVTCDPELDDHNSLLRYLLYSTDYDTEGIIYASSQVHWKGDGKGTTKFREGAEYARLGLGPQTSWRWAEGERFIHTDVEAYAKKFRCVAVVPCEDTELTWCCVERLAEPGGERCCVISPRWLCDFCPDERCRRCVTAPASRERTEPQRMDVRPVA